MPGVPLPAIDEASYWQNKTERRSIQEMFTKKLDLIASITNVDGATGGTSGLIRITAASHGLSTGDEVIIADVGGTTEANGYFTVTNVSSSQFTLDGTTFSNAWTSGGGVYNGVSYLVNVANTSGGAAPSSPGVMVVNNIKQVNTSGAVVATPQVVKKITVNTDVEIMLGDSSYGQAVSSIVITNNSGASVTGSVKIRTTKALNVDAQPIALFVLPDDYSIVLGGDGVRSMYKETGLPYVS
mgnify:FL=1